MLLAFTERAELGTDEYLSLTTILEGIVILKKNPDHEADVKDTKKTEVQKWFIFFLDWIKSEELFLRI